MIFCAVKRFGLFLHPCWEFTSNMCVFPSTKYFKLYVEHSYTPSIPNDMFYEKMSNQLMLLTLEKFNF